MIPTEAEFAAIWGALGDRFDDRVSPSLVDYEDEREVVDVLVPRMNRDLN